MCVGFSSRAQRVSSTILVSLQEGEVGVLLLLAGHC